MARARSRSACVVVPVYRMPLTKAEAASLARCVEVLGSHPIVIAKPESLDVRDLLREHPSLTCETFEDQYFEGVAGYNRLMLSEHFYARFERYDYALIHQLDALVFHDRLSDWCERGYDYIGAPWIADPALPSWPALLRRAMKRKVYRWLDRRARREPGMHYTQYAYSVGNGGFSLRRISTMRNVLATMPTEAERYRRGDAASHHEDLFFCVEANRFGNRVRVPGLREGAHFAWELHPQAAAKLTRGELPFGCHGWDKLHRDEWRPIFARFGLSIDALLSAATSDAPTRAQYESL